MFAGLQRSGIRIPTRPRRRSITDERLTILTATKTSSRQRTANRLTPESHPGPNGDSSHTLRRANALFRKREHRIAHRSPQRLDLIETIRPHARPGQVSQMVLTGKRGVEMFG